MFAFPCNYLGFKIEKLEASYVGIMLKKVLRSILALFEDPGYAYLGG